MPANMEPFRSMSPSVIGAIPVTAPRHAHGSRSRPNAANCAKVPRGLQIRAGFIQIRRRECRSENGARISLRGRRIASAAPGFLQAVLQPREETLLSRFWSVPLLLAVYACADTAPPSPTVLTPAGLGVVQLGMTLTQAETALGAQLEPMPPGADVACWMTRRADGRAPQVFYTVQNGRITRIDINTASSAGTPSNVTTPEGIGVGAAEADVLKAYGKQAKVMPSKYDEHGHTLAVENPHTRTALLFETSGGKVTTFRTGYLPASNYVEGCS